MSAPDHRFHRWIDPAARGATKSGHQVEADADELRSLAAWLDIPSVDSLKASILLTRHGTDAVKATGKWAARTQLMCGVSLEPFPQVFAGEIDLEFRKPGSVSRDQPVAGGEIEISLEADEPGEWRPQGVDLGALLAEELSLALPDFPRKPDVTLDDEVEDLPHEEAKPNPFAVLQQLKPPSGGKQ